MRSNYFYTKERRRIGGQMIEPYKAYRITNSNFPELMVLEESGIVTFVQNPVVPQPGAQIKKAASTTVLEAHKKASRKKKEEVIEEPEL